MRTDRFVATWLRSSWRSQPSRALLVCFALLVISPGCASVNTTDRADTDSPPPANNPAPAGRRRLADDELPASLPAPVTTQEARRMLELALLALDAERGREAALLLDAIARSSHLTDRGRANVYWLTAEAFRKAHDMDHEENALAGFLVAADILPADDDLAGRTLKARSRLLARKIRLHPTLGSTPEAAILVEDLREPASLLEHLACGPTGTGRYVEVHMVRDAGIAQVSPAHLLRQRATCDSGGKSLELWFDLAPTPDVMR